MNIKSAQSAFCEHTFVNAPTITGSSVAMLEMLHPQRNQIHNLPQPDKSFFALLTRSQASMCHLIIGQIGFENGWLLDKADILKSSFVRAFFPTEKRKLSPCVLLLQCRKVAGCGNSICDYICQQRARNRLDIVTTPTSMSRSRSEAHFIWWMLHQNSIVTSPMLAKCILIQRGPEHMWQCSVICRPGLTKLCYI